MFCDILMPDGTPVVRRPALRAASARSAKAADLGFTFYTHPEIEFFLLEQGPAAARCPTPIDQAATSTTRRTASATTSAARRSRCSRRWASRWSSATTRARPGQQEIDLRYADALTTADNIMTFRLVVKEVALEQGVYATFMPKPFADHPGSGMHTHLSLFEGDRNAFYEAGAEYQLSKVGRSFIAGLLKHAPEITAVTNQWVNSYKRLGGGGEAPAYVCWGHNNRSRARPRADVQAEQGQLHARRVPRARHRVQPLPRVRGAARRRPQGHRGGLRAARRAPRTTCGR